MRSVHRIVVPRSEGAGPKSERAAKQIANRHKEPGSRLYTDQRKGLTEFSFVNREKEDFRPGSIKPTIGPNGVIVETGELRDNAAPKYRNPNR